MKPKLTWLAAGAAIVTVAGTAALAGTVHHLSVKLPGGGNEIIAYSGDDAPSVTFLKPGMVRETADVRLWAPFPEMARISAMMDAIAGDMDRQMQISLQRMQRPAPGMTNALLAPLPPGTESYSLTTIATGQGVCTREVRITSRGEGARPQMVSRSSGCGDAAAPVTGLPNATAIKATPQSAAVPRQRI